MRASPAAGPEMLHGFHEGAMLADSLRLATPTLWFEPDPITGKTPREIATVRIEEMHGRARANPLAGCSAWALAGQAVVAFGLHELAEEAGLEVARLVRALRRHPGSGFAMKLAASAARRMLQAREAQGGGWPS